MGSRTPVQIVADNLRRLRLERGLTQDVLARRAGLDRTFVSLCERSHRNITVRSIFALAAGLSCAPRDLVSPDLSVASGPARKEGRT